MATHQNYSSLHEDSPANKSLSDSITPPTIHIPVPPVYESPNKHIGKVIYIGVCFLVLLTAFNSVQNLIAEIYTQLGYPSLGKMSLLCLYSVFFLSVFFTPGLIKNWNYKSGISIGSLGYIFSMIAGALTVACSTEEYFYCKIPAFINASNIVGSMLNGLTAPILWLSANRYVTACTNADNKGKYFGIFWCFISATQILGNLMSAFVITHFGQETFYLVATGFVLLASSLCCLAPHVEKYSQEETAEGVVEKAKRIVGLGFSPTMRVLLPFLFVSGITVAIQNGFEFHIIVESLGDKTKEEQNYYTALIFIVQGFFAVIASYLVGKLIDKVERKNRVMQLANLIFMLAIVFSILAHYHNSHQLSYFMGTFWGMGYSSSHAIANVIVAKDFNGSIEGYAVVQALIVLAASCGFGLTILLADHIYTFIFVVTGMLVVSQVTAAFYRSPKKDSLLLADV